MEKWKEMTYEDKKYGRMKWVQIEVLPPLLIVLSAVLFVLA